MRSPYCAGSVPVSSVHAGDEVGVEQRAERRNTLGNDDAVDSILDVGVFVSDMEIGIGYGRIVRHARHLQNDFVDRRVVTLRHVYNRLATDRVSRGSDLRQQVFSRLIHTLHLGAQSRLRCCWSVHLLGGALCGLRVGLWLRLWFICRDALTTMGGSCVCSAAGAAAGACSGACPGSARAGAGGVCCCSA